MPARTSPARRVSNPALSVRPWRIPAVTALRRPDPCHGCGAGQNDAPVIGTATRQVLDIPRPLLIGTDHVVEKRRCSCGWVTAGVFSTEATGPACWGPRVKAAAVYLLIRQQVPLERAHEAMEVLFAARWCAPMRLRCVALVTGRSRTPSPPKPTPSPCSTPRETWDRSDRRRRATGRLSGSDPARRVQRLRPTELARAAHAQCHADLDRHLIDKIAGTFRDPLHAQAFCTIRSNLQTGPNTAKTHSPTSNTSTPQHPGYPPAE